MTPEEEKKAMGAVMVELANQRRIITRLEIENDDLKKRIKELERLLVV
jgi:hypothetical protein